jgi:hypothetical protein
MCSLQRRLHGLDTGRAAEYGERRRGIRPTRNASEGGRMGRHGEEITNIQPRIQNSEIIG